MVVRNKQAQVAAEQLNKLCCSSLSDLRGSSNLRLDFGYEHNLFEAIVAAQFVIVGFAACNSDIN